MIEQRYDLAKEQYAPIGVDTDKAVQKLSTIAISLHCWQGDDVRGFETKNEVSGDHITATGNYPGGARNAEELRMDLDKTLSLIPGKHRLNLHAIYAETGGKHICRNNLQPEHFSGWIDWAKEKGLKLDFNGTFFSHSKAKDGFTLASPDEGIRKFWVEHGIACRKIGEHMGRELKSPCVTNIWIPDGYKDIPVDRKGPRQRLKKSLDEILSEKIDSKYNLDAVEPKLFGIGTESYVVGSYDFYLGYALENKLLLCLDTGHFHPTETVSDKISSVLLYLERILLHISRPVRWDSDHVVILDDELKSLAKELVTGDFLDRVHIGLDFFDASINRIAAWVIGTRCLLKGLLIALLEPADTLKEAEISGDLTRRLALMEELKTMPFGAVWDYYCMKSGVPTGTKWMDEIKSYEKNNLTKRSLSVPFGKSDVV